MNVDLHEICWAIIKLPAENAFHHSSYPLFPYDTSDTEELGEGVAESGRFTIQSTLYFVARWPFYPIR